MKPLCAEDKKLFEEMVRYILSVAVQAKGLTSDEVLRIIEEHTGKEVREMGKSFIEAAWAEGERIGIEKGERRGIEKGERRGIEKGERLNAVSKERAYRSRTADVAGACR